MKKIFSIILCITLLSSGFAQSDTIEISEKQSVTNKVINWYNSNLNYGTITLLMTIESSFIPFPSEVIVPPAAYQACNEDNSSLFVTSSKFVNVLIVILFATLGALLGALINYVLALTVGRPVVYWFADSKLGRLLLLDSAKVKKAEAYFNEHGNVSTLVGRFIPAIRQLISIPAGLAKMNIAKFMIFTSIGAACWNTILALLGYIAHGQKDLIDKYNHELTVILLSVLAVGVVYVVFKWIKSSIKHKDSENN